MAVADYYLYINGVDRAGSHVIKDSIAVRDVRDGLSTLVCDVESEDGSFRAAKHDEIVLIEDDGTSPVQRRFAGIVRTVTEEAFGGVGDGVNSIVTKIMAESYGVLPELRHIWETRPAETLKQRLTFFVDSYLWQLPTITVDPAQDDGPTLPAKEYWGERLDSVFNDLANFTDQTGDPRRIWTIDVDQTIRIMEPSTDPAPFDLIEGDGTEVGDVTVDTVGGDYNLVYVMFGDSRVARYSLSFTGDGTTSTFTFPHAGVAIFGPIHGTATGIVGYGFVTVNGVQETLGSVGSGFQWEYTPPSSSPPVITAATITRVAGAPALGAVIEITFDVSFPMLVWSSTVTSPNDRARSIIIHAPQIFDHVNALALAESEYDRLSQETQIVKFSTYRLGLRVGQIMTVTVPKRNIIGQFVVVDITTEAEPDGVDLINRVSVASFVQEHWRETLARWWSGNMTGGAGVSMLNPSIAPYGAVPGPPPYSVQWNDSRSGHPIFGGAENVLYQPDLFWDLTSPGNGGFAFVNDGTGLGLADPQRLEMGLLSSGDFSMDIFGVDASILMNATGDIIITAGVDEVGSPQGLGGAVQLNGYVSITEYAAALSGEPPAVAFLPQPFGDSYTRLHNLNVLDGLCGFYQTISALPYTVNTTTASDTKEFLAFISTAGTGTVFLPVRGTAGTPNRRMFPVTATRRMFWFYNESGTMTLDANTVGGTTIGGSNSITLGAKSSVLIMGHDTEYKLLGASGSVSGGGASSGTPAGTDKDVQFNDGGVFGGEDAFEYDKTKDQLKLAQVVSGETTLKITTSTTDAAMMGFQSQSGNADIVFGWERTGGANIARTYAPATLFWTQAGGSGASPANDEIAFEIYAGEDPGSPMTFADTRGFKISTDGIANIYQTGGLGTGAFTGMGLEIDNNTDGNGAAAYLGLKTKDDTLYYIWVDATGTPRISTAPPQEDGTPSDTSGTEFCLAPCGGGSGGSPSGSVGDMLDFQAVVKASDESLSSSSYQDDDELFFAIGANQTWLVDWNIFYNAATTDDIKIAFSGPTGVTGRWGHLGLETSVTSFFGNLSAVSSTGFTDAGNVLGGGGATDVFARFSMVVTSSSTAGNVTFRWARNAGSGTVIVRANSFLKATRIV